MNKEHLLSIKEAAAALRIGPALAYEMARDGLLPVFRPTPRVVRVLRVPFETALGDPNHQWDRPFGDQLAPDALPDPESG